ncbi:MAG: PIG-L family deacetylase [Candidatus Dormibacteria bacterium]
MEPPPLTLMVVHAHPDDEAGTTGGILHKYGREGVLTVLVTCTGGELGDGPDGLKPDQPGHDPEAVARTRRAELDASCRELGVGSLEMLGYRDSGMAEWNRGGAPGTFAAANLGEVVRRLTGLIERYRPQVVVTYDQTGGYGHPDHIRAHEAAEGAARATGIPSKLYYTAFPKSLASRVLAQMKEAGIDPWEIGPIDFDPDDPPFGVPDEQITTVVDVSRSVPAKLGAVRAHSSQSDMAFFANLPERAAPMVLGQEHYIRAYDRTGSDLPETDLFAGLR